MTGVIAILSRPDASNEHIVSNALDKSKKI